jgi:hypothetical protein
MKKTLNEEISKNLRLMKIQVNEDITDKLKNLANELNLGSLVDKITDFITPDDKKSEEDIVDYLERKVTDGDKDVNISTDEINTSSGKYTGSVSSIPSDFRGMTELVVDKFEGGYYNPQWHKKSAMGDSGETMFGIDRKYGSYLEDTPEGSEFWELVDDNKTGTDDDGDGKKLVRWGHGHDGGRIRSKLLDLVSKMMERQYESNLNNNFNSKEKEIIENDKGLKFNFFYATWNGSGFFKNFAKEIKKAIADGVTSPEELKKVAIKARRNSKVSKSASKMASIIGV